jgi:uncharacterized membrane protein YphA (DoxX/SURF4 family)
MNAVFLIGRIVFGGFFLVNGINHLTMLSMMAAYSEAKGVPAAGPAVVVTGLLLIFGGLSVLLGFRPRLGLAALIVFLVGVTPLMHGFWQVADAQARLHETTQFMKNAALLGAALALLRLPIPWPVSLDARLERRPNRTT